MINLKSKVVRGSFILLVLFGLFNLFNLLYHIAMARSLSLADYGIVKALFFFLYLGGILTESIQTVISKYSAQENDEGRLKWILFKSTKKIIPYGLIIIFLYLLVSIWLSSALRINYSLLALTSLFFLGALTAPVIRGVIQGQKRFYALGFSVLTESLTKVIIAILFVWLGFGVYGAMGGVVAGIFISLFLSLLYLKNTLAAKEKKATLRGIRNYSLPVLVATATIIAFFNVDVIIARYFFSDTVSGIYSVISTIATIIFMGTQPISKALFPITAGHKAKDASTSQSHLNKAASITLICIIFALAVFFLFPSTLISIFSNKSIPSASTPLFFLGLGDAFISLANLIIFYNLSLGRTKRYYFLPVFLFIEVILLSLFSDNLIHFSMAFMTSAAIFLWGSVVILRQNDTGNNNPRA